MLADGQITVTPNADRTWFLVEIGRIRKVKRFYLSPQEAVELITVLGRELPTYAGSRPAELNQMPLPTPQQ